MCCDQRFAFLANLRRAVSASARRIGVYERLAWRNASASLVRALPTCLSKPSGGTDRLSPCALASHHFLSLTTSSLAHERKRSAPRPSTSHYTTDFRFETLETFLSLTPRKIIRNLDHRSSSPASTPCAVSVSLARGLRKKIIYHNIIGLVGR